MILEKMQHDFRNIVRKTKYGEVQTNNTSRHSKLRLSDVDAIIVVCETRITAFEEFFNKILIVTITYLQNIKQNIKIFSGFAQKAIVKTKNAENREV